jgi:O-antigen ligase
MALDKPVWGHSLLKSKDTTVFDLGPHNMYVLVFYETGIIGLALLLAFLINNFSFYLRRHYYPGVIYWMLISCEFFFSHNIIYEYFFSFSMAYLVLYFMNDSYVKR